VSGLPGGDVALTQEVPLTWGGWTLMLTRGEPGGEWNHTVVAPETVSGLRVRARRPGDRMAGETSSKVQDVLTDAKVPASRRDAQPLVVTAAGEVWWIPGVTSRGGSGDWRVVARKDGVR